MNLIQRAVDWARKTVVSTFSTQDPGSEYLRNGYYGIYQAAYSNYSSSLGQYLTDQKAMSTAAVFGGIKIISEDVGSLSLVTRRRVAENRTEPFYDHPLYALLHDAPNPDMTAMEFREALTAHALLAGTGFAGIERRNGVIVAFWPWMPYEVTRDRDRRGSPVFIHKPGNSASKTHTLRDVFVINGFGLTGAGGLSLMQYARQTLGLTAIQEEYAARFFSQDQTPNLILEHPGKPGPDNIKNIKKAWAETNDWHAPRVLSEGMKATQLHPDADKSQLLAQRAHQVLEVCRFLRLSPHKLGDMGRATWANVEQLNINHYTETLRPWCERWEQAIKLRCLFEEPRVYVKHNIAGFLRGDFKTQTEGFGKMLEKGVFSINEVRALLDLNPTEGGDEHFIQMNMAGINQAAEAASALADSTSQGATQ